MTHNYWLNDTECRTYARYGWICDTVSFISSLAAVEVFRELSRSDLRNIPHFSATFKQRRAKGRACESRHQLL